MSHGQPHGEDHTNDIIVLVMAALHLGILGSAGAVLLAPIRTWAVSTGLLVAGDSVLLAIPGTSVGLDLGRTLVAAAALALLLLVTVWSVVRARQRRSEVL